MVNKKQHQEQESQPKEYEFVMKREYSMFYSIMCLRSLQEFAKITAGLNVYSHAQADSSWVAFYVQKNTMSKIKECMIKEFDRNQNYVEQIISDVNTKGEKFRKFAENIHIDEKMPFEVLVELSQRVLDLICEYGPPLWYSFIIDGIIVNKVEEKLKEEFPTNWQEALEHFSKPSEKAITLNIAEYFKKEHDTKKRAAFVEEHASWIGNTDPFVAPWNDQEIKNYAESYVIEHKDRIIEHKYKLKENKGKPKNSDKKKFTTANTKLINAYQECLYLKDKRDEYRREAFYYSYFLMKELARRLNISVHDLGYFDPSELEYWKQRTQYKENNQDNIHTEIKKRKEAFVLEYEDNALLISQGENAKAMFIEEEKTEEIKLIKEIKGIIGCKGKIKGKVKLIKCRDDVVHFPKDRVLVAVTTNPEHVPAMQKALAFITDEGGITCHAAIVAREMNKPCIVGCKNATKVLKDNMQVEVDADNGVVRILN